MELHISGPWTVPSVSLVDISLPIDLSRINWLPDKIQWYGLQMLLPLSAPERSDIFIFSAPLLLHRPHPVVFQMSLLCSSDSLKLLNSSANASNFKEGFFFIFCAFPWSSLHCWFLTERPNLCLYSVHQKTSNKPVLLVDSSPPYSVLLVCSRTLICGALGRFHWSLSKWRGCVCVHKFAHC